MMTPVSQGLCNYDKKGCEFLDTNVMNKISYGLYVLTAVNCGFANGCIINTLAQVTVSPNRVSVTVSKSNFTNYMIRQSGVFNVSVIDETADFSLFERFGFASGRWENKFSRRTCEVAKNGVPYVNDGTCAYISCRVVSTVDLGTHTMFIADVTDAVSLSDSAPMTYAFYHANVKPKPAVRTEKADDSVKTEKWVCNICGYVYEGSLPEDFVCPICKHGAGDFSRIE